MSRCPRLVTLKNSLAAQHAKSSPCYTPLPSSHPPSFSLGLCMPLPSCHLLRALVTPTRKPQHCQLPKQFSANPLHSPLPCTLPYRPPLSTPLCPATGKSATCQLHAPPALPQRSEARQHVDLWVSQQNYLFCHAPSPLPSPSFENPLTLCHIVLSLSPLQLSICCHLSCLISLNCARPTLKLNCLWHVKSDRGGEAARGEGGLQLGYYWQRHAKDVPDNIYEEKIEREGENM